MARTITSSVYCPPCCGIRGCTDPRAINYNPNATINDGSCRYGIRGCTDPNALNYNPNATIDNGSCIYSGQPPTPPQPPPPPPEPPQPPTCGILSCAEFDIPTYGELKDQYWGTCRGSGVIFGDDANNPPVRGRFFLRPACIRFFYRVISDSIVLCEDTIGPAGSRSLKSALELAVGYRTDRPSILNGEECGLYIYPIIFYGWHSVCTHSPINNLGGAQFAFEGTQEQYCQYIRIYNIDAFSVGC